MRLRRILVTIAVFVVVTFTVVAIEYFAHSWKAGGQDAVSPAVFLVLAINLKTGTNDDYGTGFFISRDGKALTASHVVYPAVHHGDILIALVGHDLYGADVVCSDTLPYDPTTTTPSESDYSRDTAEIQVRKPDAPRARWTDKSGAVIATAHQGPMPTFPFLTIAGRILTVGETVTIQAYGDLNSGAVQRFGSGQVRDTFVAHDGTPIAVAAFNGPQWVPSSGNSGAPVLDATGRVVGLLGWDIPARPGEAAIESAVTLLPPCR